MFKKFISIIIFYWFAVEHHQYPVAHETYYAEVVRDKDIGKMTFFF